MERSVWLNEKPEFNEECTFVTASKIQSNWEYSVWIIEKLETDEGWYFGWLTGDGDEYGDINDITADKYFILPDA